MPVGPSQGWAANVQSTKMGIAVALSFRIRIRRGWRLAEVNGGMVLDAEAGSLEESQPNEPFNPVWTTLFLFLGNHIRISIAELTVVEHDSKRCGYKDQFFEETHARTDTTPINSLVPQDPWKVDRDIVALAVRMPEEMMSG